jgi:hypothetical protein
MIVRYSHSTFHGEDLVGYTIHTDTYSFIPVNSAPLLTLLPKHVSFKQGLNSDMSYQGVFTVDSRVAGPITITNPWTITNQKDTPYTFQDGSTAYVEDDSTVLYVNPRTTTIPLVEIPFTPLAAGFPRTLWAQDGPSAAVELELPIKVADSSFSGTASAAPTAIPLLISHTPLPDSVTIHATLAPFTLLGKKLTATFDVSDLPVSSLRSCFSDNKVDLPITQLDGFQRVLVDLTMLDDIIAPGAGNVPVALSHITVSCDYDMAKLEDVIPMLPASASVTVTDEGFVAATAHTTVEYPALPDTRVVAHKFDFTQSRLLGVNTLLTLQRAYAEGLRTKLKQLVDAQVTIRSQELIINDNMKKRLQVTFYVIPRMDVPVDIAAVQSSVQAIVNKLAAVGYSGENSIDDDQVAIDGMCAYSCCFSCPAEAACMSDDQCASGTCKSFACTSGSNDDPDDKGTGSNWAWYVIIAVVVLGSGAAGYYYYRKRQLRPDSGMDWHTLQNTGPDAGTGSGYSSMA